MLRGAAIAVLVMAACGGTAEPERGNGSSSSSSGSTQPSPSPSPALTPGFVRCPTADASCAVEPAAGSVCCLRTGDSKCETGPDACADGDPRGCDEGADCASGVCCAEGGLLDPTTNQYGVSTYCRPSCITNVPRVDVCNLDADCASGVCREWSCGGFEMRGLKTCAPLGPCADQ